MNLRTEIQKLRSEVKAIEGRYKDVCSMNSKNMEDYLELNYFSGVHNGLNFLAHLLDGAIKENEFEALKKKLLHQEKVN